MPRRDREAEASPVLTMHAGTGLQYDINHPAWTQQCGAGVVLERVEQRYTVRLARPGEWAWGFLQRLSPDGFAEVRLNFEPPREQAKP